jgi:hypothetical protein
MESPLPVRRKPEKRNRKVPPLQTPKPCNRKSAKPPKRFPVSGLEIVHRRRYNRLAAACGTPAQGPHIHFHHSRKKGEIMISPFCFSV